MSRTRFVTNQHFTYFETRKPSVHLGFSHSIIFVSSLSIKTLSAAFFLSRRKISQPLAVQLNPTLQKTKNKWKCFYKKMYCDQKQPSLLTALRALNSERVLWCAPSRRNVCYPSPAYSAAIPVIFGSALIIKPVKINLSRMKSCQ